MQQRLLIFSRLISSEEKDTCLQLGKREGIRDLSRNGMKRTYNLLIHRKSAGIFGGGGFEEYLIPNVSGM